MLKKIGLIELNPKRDLFATIKNLNQYVEINFSQNVFKDSEVDMNYSDSIRNMEIIIAGETDTHDNFFKFFTAIDAAKRAGADKINCVIPYLGYARQDKKHNHRGNIGAKMVLDIFEKLGADSIYTIDLHSESIEGFFNGPVIHIAGLSVFKQDIRELIYSDPNKNFIMCSPDAGGILRARRFASEFGLELATCGKERIVPNEVSKITITNGSVKGKYPIIVDDIGDTLGTIEKTVKVLKENGALGVYVILTHAVFSGVTKEKIESIGAEKIYVTNTIFKNSIVETGVTVVNANRVICEQLNTHLNREI